jgi:hypothetical protein
VADPWPEAVKRRNKLRPRPVGMGGALLALVVAVVVFIGLVLWYTVNPSDRQPRTLAELDAVHAVSTACGQRHPQLARGPEDYLSEALPLLERARFEIGFDDWDHLQDLFCRSLALDADRREAVFGWAEVQGLATIADPENPRELDAAWELMLAVHRLDPDTEGLRSLAAVLHKARSDAKALDTSPTVR